jgi:hypothetical protein
VTGLLGTCSRAAAGPLGLLLLTSPLSPSAADRGRAVTERAPCSPETDSARGVALREAVESAPPGTRIQLDACVYRLYPRSPAGRPHSGDRSAILVRDRHGIVIHGAGPSTRIVLTDSVYVGFQIATDTRGFAISDLTIEGSVLASEVQDTGRIQPEPTHAIASGTSESGIRDVTISRLEIMHVAVGISVGSPFRVDEDRSRCVEGTYVGVRIEDNYIHDVVGSEPGGQGYGIHLECAEQAVVRGNRIERVDRHSIYQGLTGPGPNSILIDNNLIVDHGWHAWVRLSKHIALAVARSSDVTVSNNVIVHPQSYALSIERPDVAGLDDPVDVRLVTNVVLGQHAPYSDVLLTAPGVYTAWGNRFYHPSGRAAHWLRRVGQGRLHEPVAVAGAQVVAGEGLGGRTFMIRQGRLQEIGPAAASERGPGPIRTGPDRWSGVDAMTVLGGRVYLAVQGRLEEIDTERWERRREGPRHWGKVVAMAGHSDRLFIVSKGVLHRVAPATWSIEADTSYRWADVRGMVSSLGHLYILDGRCTYELLPPFTRRLLACLS